MRGLSPEEEAVLSEFVECMARWVVDHANHQVLAGAINRALDQYDKNYTEQLNRWRRSQQQELPKENPLPKENNSKAPPGDDAEDMCDIDAKTVPPVPQPQQNGSTLLESVGAGLQCVATATANLFKRAASTTADMTSAALVECQARMHPNRANAFRNQYGILKVESFPAISDSEYVVAKLVISPATVQKAFLEGMLGSDGWKIEAHTLWKFGYPSMKTLIMREVQTMFVTYLKNIAMNEEKRGQFCELFKLFDPLAISEQAHWTYFSVSSIAKALLSTHDKWDIAVQTMDMK